MHEVAMVSLPVGVVLEALQQLEEDVLRHLASPALEVGEPRQPEVGIQLVGGGVEGAADGGGRGGRLPAQLQLLGLVHGVGVGLLGRLLLVVHAGLVHHVLLLVGHDVVGDGVPGANVERVGQLLEVGLVFEVGAW